MNREKIQQILGGVTCLLLVRCTSTPLTNTDQQAEIYATSFFTPQAEQTVVDQGATQTPGSTLSDIQMQCGADINKMVYSPNGAFLAAVSNESIYVCDVETLTLQTTLSFEQSITGGVAWSSDSMELATGLSDGAIWVWNAATEEKHLAFEASGEMVSGLTWSPAGDRLLAISGYDRDMHVWDVLAGTQLSTISPFGIGEVAWTPDSGQFAVGCACDRVTVWHAETGQPSFSFRSPAPIYDFMAWSPDGKRFVGGFGTTVIYDATTAEELFSLDTRIVAWSPDGKWLAGALSIDTNIIHIWDASTGEDMAVVDSLDGITSLAWSPDGKQLTGGTQDGLVILWNLQELTFDSGSAPKTALSEKGPWYAFTASSILYGSRYLWAVNAIDGTGLTKLAHEPVTRFAVRPTDSGENSATIAYVTSSPTSGQNTLWTVTLPNTEAKPITSQSGGGSLSWSPDGHKLAFDGSEDGVSSNVYIYDIDTGTIDRISDGKGNVLDMRWSPDGRYIVYERYDVTGMGGPILSGIWATQADGLREIPLIELANVNFIDYQWFKGWLSSSEILLADSDDGGIREVNLETSAVTSIYEDDFFEAIFVKEHNAWLLTGAYSPEPDMPLILIHSGEKSAIPSHSISKIWWSSANDLFFGVTERGQFYTISPLGEISKMSLSAKSLYDYEVVASPDQTWWAWRPFYSGTEQPVWVGAAMSEPAQEISHVSDITWSPDSQRLMVLDADGLWMAEQPDFEPVHIVEGDVYAAYDYWSWLTWEGEWIP